MGKEDFRRIPVRNGLNKTIDIIANKFLRLPAINSEVV
jgi:hypothetical protein